MRNSAFLIITALILALGGYWFFSQAGESTGGASLSMESNGDPASAAMGKSGDLPQSSEPKTPEAVVASSDRSEVESAAPASEEKEIAEQTIRGRVVNSMGSAVVGARVKLGVAAELDGFLLGRAIAGGLGEDDESVQTDERGIFVLPSEVRGPVTIEVNSAGYAPLRATKEVPPGDAAEIGDLVLEQGVRLAGHVVDESGSGIAGAQIRKGQLNSGGFQIRFAGQSLPLLATTGPNGEFEIDELMAGPHALVISHELHPTLRAEGSTKRPGETVVDLRYELEDGHFLAGIVRELPPGENDQYAVRAYPGRDVMNAVDSESYYADMALTEIESDGRFRFQGLREGSYRLQVIPASSGGNSFANGLSASVLAKTGEVDVELALREPMGVTFRVVDATSGEPCTTYAASIGDNFFGTRGVQESEHEDGRTTVESVDVRGDSSRADIRVTAAGYSPAVLENVTLMPGVVKDIGVIRLEPVPIVTVEVLDAITGEPIKGARATLSEMMEDTNGTGRRMAFSIGGNEDDEEQGSGLDNVFGGQTSRGKTDENGMTELASMPGKRCQIAVTHRKYADAELLDLELPMSGEKHFTLRMTKGGTVTVTVYDAEGNLAKGVPVKQTLLGEQAAMVFGGPGGRKTRKDGTVVFKHLAPGSHNFKISDSGGAGSFSGNGAQVLIMGGGDDDADPGEDVVVTEGSELEVTLHKKPEGFLEGQLTEAGESLAGATLAFAAKATGGGRRMGMPRMPDFGGGKTARTNGAGSYLMEGLKVGTYTVTVTHPDRIMPMEYEVDIRAGKNKSDYDLPIAILEGRVTDVEGKPVAGIDVRPTKFRSQTGGQPTRMVMTMVRGDGGGGAVTMSTGPSEGSARTDAEGFYILRGVTPDVDLVVECSSDKYQKAQSDKVSVKGDQTRTGVDLTVQAAGGVTVSVLNPDGSPGEFCMVTLEYADQVDPMPEAVREFTGETGVATARGLRPGFWRVSGRTVTMGPGGNSDPRTTQTAEVEIVAGETAELTLELD